MSEVDPHIVDEILAACKVGVEEAAAAIGRAFDKNIQLALGQPGTFQSLSTSLGLSGPGLVITLKIGDPAVLITLPAGGGLAPAWCAEPDLSGQSRLATLAQEVGMNLLPETWIPEDFAARWVKNLAAALSRGGVAPDAGAIPLAVSEGGQPRGTIGLVWPAGKPAAVYSDPEPQAAPARAAPVPPPKQPVGRPRDEQPTLPLTSCDLPSYTRSLLRVKVPVVVTLAEKRQLLSRIVELGPGAIIQFDKSCEEMLELEVGNRRVACGEAVKVGDKFGLRITSMLPPEERFNPLRSTDAKRR